MKIVKCMDCGKRIGYSDNMHDDIVCAYCTHVRKRGAGAKVKIVNYEKKTLGKNRRSDD